MRNNVIIIVISIFAIAGCAKKDKYDPGQFLTIREQDKIMSVIIRYQAKGPKNVSDSMKYNSQYDVFYEDQKKHHQLIGYYINRNKDHFFLTRRRAASNSEKYVATGGKMRFGEGGDPQGYEEVFRTWKLQADTLKIRALYLFDLMISGESLEPYKTKTAGFHYIEFPDDDVYFDKEERRWASKRIHSTDEYVKEEVLKNKARVE